jgi:hypothetical protein
MSEENGASRGYWLMVWSPTGYSLRELQGDPPPVGHEFEEGGFTLVVTKIGPSPFPADTRPCAFSLGRA